MHTFEKVLKMKKASVHSGSSVSSSWIPWVGEAVWPSDKALGR